MNGLLILGVCCLVAAVVTWVWGRADNALDRRDRRALLDHPKTRHGCRCGKYHTIPGPVIINGVRHESTRCYFLPREGQP